jgi:CubicO group peptidase (beta-lactamase class C family)
MNKFSEALSRLDYFIHQKMQEYHTPGLAIAITDREQLLHICTYGKADIAADIPVTPETLFPIASISKSFTSIALLQLYEAGQLDLHIPVTQYLPWFRVKSAYEPITIHHLLSHTAGIITGRDFTPNSHYEVVALAQTEVTSPPGEYFHYSNVGYKALGWVLEHLISQSYAEILRQRIFQPLGMINTEPVITNAIRNRLAVGYQRFYDDRPYSHNYPLVPAPWLEYAAGDGSIASTPADMAIYLRFLLNKGRTLSESIISENNFNLMVQPVIKVNKTEEVFYGYGLASGRFNDQNYIFHDGGTIGHLSNITFDLDNGLGVVVLCNRPGNPGEISKVALQLITSELSEQELPSLPAINHPTVIENANDYAGTYLRDNKQLTFLAQNQHLILEYQDKHIILERRYGDSFYVNHPDFALFLLTFKRSDNQVVEVFYGEQWYVSDHYTQSKTFNYPPEWLAYTGHYRSHNPWYSNFRIILRQDKLWIIYPVWGDGELLVPQGNGVFRIGEDERTPERIKFDSIISDRALGATISGCDYYRTFDKEN